MRVSHSFEPRRLRFDVRRFDPQPQQVDPLHARRRARSITAAGFDPRSSFEPSRVAIARPVPAPAPAPTPPPAIDDDGAFLDASGRAISPTTNLDQIAGVVPSDGRPPQGRAVYINGVGTSRDNMAVQMQEVADVTGAEIVGLFNGSDGFLKDAWQTIRDRLDVGGNPAVGSLTHLILSSVQDGEPLRLMAYSQGAAITTRALDDAKQALLDGGMTLEQAEDALASIRVETFGGAASHYPDGPEYVHHVNRWDPVSVFSWFAFGLDRDPLVEPGRGAQVHYFTDFAFNPHALELYLENRAAA